MGNKSKSNFNKIDNQFGLSAIEKRWYQNTPGALIVLKPLECVFRRLSLKRKNRLQENEFLPSVPTIVVGNITVGGTGKTPIVVALVKYFQGQGYTPGVVSRGYGRRSKELLLVDSYSIADDVGDEPLLIFNEAHCPVAVSADRVKAAEALIDKRGVDLIISDDGLQHYALGRHIEIAVIDAKRMFGNGHCLPVGPLRESQERLNETTCLVINNNKQNDLFQPMLSWLDKPIFSSQIRPLSWQSVSGNEQRPLKFFENKTVHALAGIGQPEKFFATLKSLGVLFEPHVFSDHYRYKKEDFDFLEASGDNQPCLMTSKDAVKCKTFDLSNAWQLNISLDLPEHFYTSLDSWMKAIQT